MLNESLYKGLKLAIMNGRLSGTIKVSNQGIRLSGRYVDAPRTASSAISPAGATVVASPAKKRLDIYDWGETYNVCCPFCNDHRNRLAINHHWNTPDEVTGSKNMNLLKCYNEDCMKDFDNIRELVKISEYSLVNRTAKRSAVTIQIDEPTETPTIVTLPDDLCDICNLPDDHPVKIYLRGHGYSPDSLSKRFDLKWCENSPRSQERNRLIVPIELPGNSNLGGYQARYIGENGDGLAPHGTAKWWTAPGTRIGQLLYNYNAARSWRYCVLMEGAADVWRLGTPHLSEFQGPGMAVFGHTVKTRQAEHLRRLWNGSYSTVFIAFDSDVWDTTLATAECLKRELPNATVLPVRLPDGKDPADMSHVELWQCIIEANRTSDSPICLG